MANKELSMIDLVIEAHTGLERQGPGSPEMTLKALSSWTILIKICW